MMIVMDSIEKSYPQKKGQALPILKGIHLHIRPSEYVALVGASGSGKSTLMNLLGCLDSPTAGSYLLDGVEVSHMDNTELCAIRQEKIGFVFQGFQLLQKLSALDNVAFPLMLRGMPPHQREKQAMQALGQVGLSQRAHHHPNALSGGQQQRVALARALCYAPKLLLCDEPTGALDTQSRDDILSLFDQLHQRGHTIAVITHDPCVASRAMKRYQVKDGQVTQIIDSYRPH